MAVCHRCHRRGTTVLAAAQLEMLCRVAIAPCTARRAPSYPVSCRMGTTPRGVLSLVLLGPPRLFAERDPIVCMAFRHTARLERLVQVRAWRPPSAPGAAARATSALWGHFQAPRRFVLLDFFALVA